MPQNNPKPFKRKRTFHLYTKDIHLALRDYIQKKYQLPDGYYEGALSVELLPEAKQSHNVHATLVLERKGDPR